MSSEKTHYELTTGAVAMLHEILPTPQWYKDDPKQGRLLGYAFDAIKALPDVERPLPQKDELKHAYDKRVDEWASPILEFEWTDKQKEAAKKCCAYYLKLGSFSVTAHSVALLALLGLNDD